MSHEQLCLTTFYAPVLLSFVNTGTDDTITRTAWHTPVHDLQPGDEKVNLTFSFGLYLKPPKNYACLLLYKTWVAEKRQPYLLHSNEKGMM